MHNLEPAYVVGLVDGEGSFTIYIRNPDEVKHVTRRVVVEPKFYVKLIEKDVEILHQLQKFFGCGSIYSQKDSRPRHQNCYRYEVFRWEDLHSIIIPFFEKNELKFVSKRTDFLLFKEMIDLLMKGHHKTESGLRELFELKQRMH
jgi:hypothetical protein